MITQHFPYTPEGCRRARAYLANRGLKVSDRMSGWEIVHEANKNRSEILRLRENIVEGIPWPYITSCKQLGATDIRNQITTEAAIIDQTKPSGNGRDIATLVQKDIETRAKKGEQTYGERLKAHNGRNALFDAYQEALDLCMYLRQKIEEEE